MIDEKWNAFMNSGKISDYLEYKKSAEQSAAETGGEANEMAALRGIVLKEFPVGENDKFIHVFTIEQGVIEISVKGGQKLLSKNAGAIQLYAYSDFSVRIDKGRYYLDSSEPIRFFIK